MFINRPKTLYAIRVQTVKGIRDYTVITHVVYHCENSMSSHVYNRFVFVDLLCYGYLCACVWQLYVVLDVDTDLRHQGMFDNFNLLFEILYYVQKTENRLLSRIYLNKKGTYPFFDLSTLFKQGVKYICFNIIELYKIRFNILSEFLLTVTFCDQSDSGLHNIQLFDNGININCCHVHPTPPPYLY